MPKEFSLRKLLLLSKRIWEILKSLRAVLDYHFIAVFDGKLWQVVYDDKLSEFPALNFFGGNTVSSGTCLCAAI